jgi:hypothetical protein
MVRYESSVGVEPGDAIGEGDLWMGYGSNRCGRADGSEHCLRMPMRADPATWANIHRHSEPREPVPGHTRSDTANA